MKNFRLIKNKKRRKEARKERRAGRGKEGGVTGGRARKQQRRELKHIKKKVLGITLTYNLKLILPPRYQYNL
jgi:hypothetical protein